LALLFARYDAAKRARALLDFDDLIAAVNALLGAEDARAWVQYKLDAGIRHVLVDESQDTNPEQWGAIDLLVKEFFAGEGQISAPRTLFSVGDPKQSIYSFQGADPELFELKGRHYARAASLAGKSFQNVEIRYSFRTLAPILMAVDHVFDDEARRKAVLSIAPVVHGSARMEPGGQVVVWPAFSPPEAVKPTGAWPLVPAEGQYKSAERALAEHIAREIAGWLNAGRRLASGRKMRADDVMILLQTRSALYFEIIRALGGQGLATPGADRLAVHAHIAVLDLLALGDVLVNRSEDLQLAAVLRSPLFGLSEDELFELAHDRRGMLWQALKTSDNPAAREAHAVLGGLRERLDRLRPYELFAEVLYARGGLKRLKARLGPEVDDVIAEFLALALAHEQADQPGLEGFLAQMRARQVSIKRELSEIGGGVRVMTIHAAKGLEAPIVVLADALAKPSSSSERQGLHVVATPAGETLVYAGSQAEHVEETSGTRQETLAGIEREYWRKLYVGMTRAEEALYVGGAYKGNAKPENQRQGSWYGAICETLFGIGDDIDEPLVWEVPPPEEDAPAPVVQDEAERVEAAAPLVLAPLVERPPVAVLTPSGLGIAHTPLGLDTRAQQAIDADLARRQGIALHALLDHLMRVAPDDREAAGRAALGQLLAEDRAGHEALLAKALRIIGAQEFARVFGPDSRGEVPFIAPARRDGTPVKLTGRIDRLVVDEAGVLVIDYKSDAASPSDPAAVPANYTMQLSLYAMVASQLFPGRTVKAGILWTSLESLMFLPDALLADARRGFTLE
jgi:ATP-dependent helicase/nuclease subunit A